MSAKDVLHEWDRLRLEAMWPNPVRLQTAFRLAPNVETCRLLLLDLPVPAGMLDRGELARARRETHVRLERPVDSLSEVAA